MNKRSVEWHVECLKNRLKGIAEDKREIDRLKYRYKKSMAEVSLYQKQIATARDENRDGFDRDTYLINRKSFKQY